MKQNIVEAYIKKKIRYTHLTTDIEDNGYVCNNVPFEVGSRGHLTLENRSSLSTIHKLFSPKLKLKTFLQTISKICLLCSYHIYNSRSERGWSDPPYLRPYKPSVWKLFYVSICETVSVSGNETCKFTVVRYFQL